MHYCTKYGTKRLEDSKNNEEENKGFLVRKISNTSKNNDFLCIFKRLFVVFIIVFFVVIFSKTLGGSEEKNPSIVTNNVNKNIRSIDLLKDKNNLMYDVYEFRNEQCMEVFNTTKNECILLRDIALKYIRVFWMSLGSEDTYLYYQYMEFFISQLSQEETILLLKKTYLDLDDYQSSDELSNQLIKNLVNQLIKMTDIWGPSHFIYVECLPIIGEDKCEELYKLLVDGSKKKNKCIIKNNFSLFQEKASLCSKYMDTYYKKSKEYGYDFKF